MYVIFIYPKIFQIYMQSNLDYAIEEIWMRPGFFAPDDYAHTVHQESFPVPGSLHTQYMTQIMYDPHDRSVEITTDRTVNPSELEKAVLDKGLPREAAKKAKKSGESVNYADSRYKTFLTTGELENLSHYLPNSYKNIPKIRYRQGSDKHKDAVAFTSRRDLVGVNTDFREKAYNIAKDAGIDQRTAELFVMYHEDVHRGQPDKVRSNSLVAEADAEYQVAQSFYHAALDMQDGKTAKEYMNAAQYALSRHVAQASKALNISPQQYVSLLSNQSKGGKGYKGKK